ncbi:hypothetical protein [Burkholderia sp. Leaf177]|uniref:hypothetical protein n=1 Tax=Burkholderia sp. Leaf177 TaxID=1736287 RepID=UPI0012E3BFF8|nr:hypothetical protein [Burkholderia sp. Leaf177]
MKQSFDSRFKLSVISITLASSLILAACGGGGGSDSSASPTPTPTPKPTPAPTPAISDNVFFSMSPSDGVITTINKAGYLRSTDMSTASQPLNIALGSTPMTGTGALSTGNGWLSANGSFIPSTVSLTLNSDATTYTLKSQSSNGQITNSKLQASTYVITPTLAALAGNFGITPYYLVTVTGDTFSGLFGYECAWRGTLSSNSKTIDLTHVTFENTKNPTGLACARTGKEYTGTAFLEGPSVAYPRGTLVINIDDGGSGMPTMSKLYYFIRP